MLPPFKIRIDSGLCDRLRVIFSFQNPMRRQGRELMVCWKPNDACPGHFLDVFEPIPGIHFTEDPTSVDWDDNRGDENNDPRMKYLLHDLQPQPFLWDRIAMVRQQLQPDYIAVHVRRTDKLQTETANELTTDAEFFRFCDHRRRGAEKLFLACDNAETQAQFQTRYPEHLVVAAPINPTTALRQTDLTHAVVDMFVCAQAREYLGTNLSGYSILVETMYQEYRQKKR